MSTLPVWPISLYLFRGSAYCPNEEAVCTVVVRENPKTLATTQLRSSSETFDKPQERLQGIENDEEKIKILDQMSDSLTHYQVCSLEIARGFEFLHECLQESTQIVSSLYTMMRTEQLTQKCESLANGLCLFFLS